MEPTQAVAILVAYMNSSDLDISDSVRNAATVYDRACRALNDRLAYCAELVKANQRSEAIRQATLKPDVLREYATLDNQELALWRDTARQEGLPTPPRLDAPVAQRLHVAFTAEQAVLPLLQRYRLLALRKSSLLERLDVLRELARAEPGNPAWGEDLRAHETARFSEIRKELDDPEQGWDLAVINELDREVSAAASPPRDIVEALREREQAIREAGGADELARLNPQLLQAMRNQNFDNDNDYKRVKWLHARVGAAATRYGIPMANRSMEPFRRAETWLKDARAWRKRKQEFDRTVGAIRVALSKKSDWGSVLKLYRELIEFTEFVIPADVAEDFEEWASSRRMFRVTLAGLGLIAILSGVVIYLAFIRG